MRLTDSKPVMVPGQGLEDLKILVIQILILQSVIL